MRNVLSILPFSKRSISDLCGIATLMLEGVEESISGYNNLVLQRGL
jgi:hypothetical protein